MASSTYSQYSNLVRLGVSDAVILRLMGKDGVLDAEAVLSRIRSEFGPNDESNQPHRRPPLKDDPEYSEYFKMLKAKVPRRWILDHLKLDGKNPNVLDLDPDLSLWDQRDQIEGGENNVEFSADARQKDENKKKEERELDVPEDSMASIRAVTASVRKRAGETSSDSLLGKEDPQEGLASALTPVSSGGGGPMPPLQPLPASVQFAHPPISKPTASDHCYVAAAESTEGMNQLPAVENAPFGTDGDDSAEPSARENKNEKSKNVCSIIDGNIFRLNTPSLKENLAKTHFSNKVNLNAKAIEIEFEICKGGSIRFRK